MVLLATISDLISKARAEKARSEQTPRLSGTTIHVIDDDPVIREAMRRLFEAENYRVITYPSAEDFLDAPRPEGAACLLIDNLLPDMDGVSLIDRLRAEKTRLPTVMLTGHGDCGHCRGRHEGRRRGPDREAGKCRRAAGQCAERDRIGQVRQGRWRARRSARGRAPQVL